jgi:hypothetical protein
MNIMRTLQQNCRDVWRKAERERERVVARIGGVRMGKRFAPRWVMREKYKREIPGEKCTL